MAQRALEAAVRDKGARIGIEDICKLCEAEMNRPRSVTSTAEELSELRAFNENYRGTVWCVYKNSDGEVAQIWRPKSKCLKVGNNWIPKMEFCLTHLGVSTVNRELLKIFPDTSLGSVGLLQGNRKLNLEYLSLLESLTMAAAMKAGVPYQPLDVEAAENERLAAKVKKPGTTPASEMVEKESSV